MPQAQKLFENADTHHCGACDSKMEGDFCSIKCESLPIAALDRIHELNNKIFDLEKRIADGVRIMRGETTPEKLVEVNRSTWFE